MDTFWPLYRAQMERMAAIRGTRLPSREGYLAEIETGALFVGSPETVARKIVTSVRTLGLARFDLKYDAHGSSIQDRARTVELLGTAVRPLVDEALAGDEPAPEASPDAPDDPRLGANAVFGGRTDELAKHRDATVRGRS